MSLYQQYLQSKKSKTLGGKVSRFFTPVPNRVRIRDIIREVPGTIFGGIKATPRTAVGIAKEIPGATKRVAGFAKDILLEAPAQAGARGVMALTGQKEFRPETRLERFFLGEKPVTDIRGYGEETFKSLGVSEETAKKYGLSGGLALTALDIFPGGQGKLAKASTKIAKLKNADEILDTLRGIVKGNDEALRPLANSLVEVTSPAKVRGILDTATKVNIGKAVAETAPTIKGAFDPEAYVKSQIERSKQLETKIGVAQKSSEFLADVKRKLVDFAAPIEDAVATAAKKAKVSFLPQADITNQIDRTLRAPQLAGAFLKDKGLDKIIRDVDDLAVFDEYLKAKHAIDLDTRGIETGVKLSDSEKLVKAYANKYEPYAKVVRDYTKSLLDEAVDGGLISKQLAQSLKIRYPNYVPFQRIMDVVESGQPVTSKAIASLSKQSVVKGIKGSTRAIESPIKSILEKTYDVIQQSEKNKTARLLASFKGLGDIPIKELPKGVSGKNTFSFLDNGIKRTFETTPEIAAAAKNLSEEQMGFIGKLFSVPTRVLRIGTTGINVPFIAANVVKDQTFAAVTSDEMMHTFPLANPSAFLKAIANAVKHGDLYDDLVRAGAGGTAFDISRTAIPKTIEQIRAGRSIGAKAKFLVKNPSQLFRAVEDIVGRAEELTRMQQFKGTRDAAIARGMSMEDATVLAARAARENTANFARRGEWGRVLNGLIPYLNAGIQGSRSLVRSVRRSPKATGAKIATLIFTPVATVTAWNLNDPVRKKAYEDIADFEKEGNMIIIPPNPTKDETGKWNVIKVPLPPGLADLSSVIRRGMEQYHGLDPVRFSDVASGLIGTVSPVKPTKADILSTLVPQAIKPSVESITNYSFYKDKEIVPEYLQKLSPELQTYKSTSGTVRKIAKPLGLSPIKVEEFIKGTFGGVGAQVINLADRILAGLDVIPKEQIGGKSISDSIIYRFSEAYGGKLEKEEQDRLSKVIQKQTDDSFRNRQQAEVIFNALKQMPREKAATVLATLKKSKPEIYKKIEKVAKDEKLGLTYSDRLLQDLHVENGERAKFIFETLKMFKTQEEKQEYIKDLVKKKIISKNVLKQLIRLYQQ